MSDYERETRITRDPDYVEERTTVDNTPNDTVYVERRGSALPWVLAFIVAVLAILMIFLLMNRPNPATNADDLAAAMDAGRAAGYAEGASTAISQMPPATTTVPVPVPVPSGSIDTSGVERSAAEAAEAARQAREAAERAADSVADAATTTPATNTAP